MRNHHSIKRGVIVEITHGALRNRTDIEFFASCGVDFSSGAWEVGQLDDFGRDVILLKIRAWDLDATWLPIVPEGTEYPRVTAEEFIARTKGYKPPPPVRPEPWYRRAWHRGVRWATR